VCLLTDVAGGGPLCNFLNSTGRPDLRYRFGALAFWPPGASAPIIHKTNDSDPLDALRDAMLSGPCEVWIEDVPCFAGKLLPGSAMFRLGKNCGIWEGLARGLGISIRLTRPQDWQAGISGVGKLKGAERKRALRTAASRIFPQVKVTLDNCDALLILDFGRRVNGFNPSDN